MPSVYSKHPAVVFRKELLPLPSQRRRVLDTRGPSSSSLLSSGQSKEDRRSIFRRHGRSVEEEYLYSKSMEAASGNVSAASTTSTASSSCSSSSGDCRHSRQLLHSTSTPSLSFEESASTPLFTGEATTDHDWGHFVDCSDFSAHKEYHPLAPTFFSPSFISGTEPILEEP